MLRLKGKSAQEAVDLCQQAFHLADKWRNPVLIMGDFLLAHTSELVEFRRGRGVTVTGIGPQRSAVVAKARELVALARRYGYRPEELAEIIEQVS